MKSCQYLAYFCFILLSLISFAQCLPTAEAEPRPDFEPKRRLSQTEAPKFVVIKEDVIPDVENTTQKVIRVNPLDLPPIEEDPNAKNMDSSLYNIQSLIPASVKPSRNYLNSNRMRKPRPLTPRLGEEDSPILRSAPRQPKLQKPKRKQLHFLYDQAAIDGHVVGKSMRVHVAPGAYPVYYVLAKTNGRFGKHPIKGFRTPTEFMKYLLKTKSDKIDLAQNLKFNDDENLAN